jgi:hypothetical protein
LNVETVAGWLEAAGVPPQVVSIGAEADNAWCLLRADPADTGSGPEWEVFWREQGNRYDWARFTNEHVACFYLFGRLAWTQVASGVLRIPDPAVPS